MPSPDGESQRRVAVLGAGAVGGMIAARTSALCVGTARTVEAVRARGLRLEHPDGSLTVRVEAVERLEQPVELLVVAVKAHQLEGALERIAADVLGPDTVVLPLLNGLEQVEATRRLLSRGAAQPVVVAGSIGRFEAHSPEPGVVVQRSRGAHVTIGSDVLDRHELERVAELLRVEAIEVAVGASEAQVLWEKAARLAVLAAATVASGVTLGELRADGRWSERLRQALDEACSAAAVHGADVDATAQWAVLEGLPDAFTTSTARDAAAGRPTELDAIAGSVLRAAAAAGVATPVLAQLVAEAAQRLETHRRRD